MKSYLKIISSIFIASLSLAIIAALISAVVMLFSGEFDIRGITIPFVFAWFGFLLFVCMNDNFIYSYSCCILIQGNVNTVNIIVAELKRKEYLQISW